MKHFKAIFNTVTLSLMVIIWFNSCTDSEEQIESDNSIQETLEIGLSAEIDQVDNILGDLVIDAYEAQDNNDNDRAVYDAAIPECVTIEIVAQKNFREVTLDFGNEGCIVNGHLLRGQIIFDYTRNPEAQQIMINYNLVDFYFDAKNVIASRSILRELSNENGNPQFTHTLDVTVIWPNGLQASREGMRVREWVEGFGTGTFSDNVFGITGKWTANFVNGNTHAYEVQTALRREIGCPFLVSGSFSVERTNFGGLFDYGDGSCDELATFTFNNGQVIDISLD